jgi:hypothetical protein
MLFIHTPTTLTGNAAAGKLALLHAAARLARHHRDIFVRVMAVQVATGSIESAVHTLSGKLDMIMLTVMAKANKEQRCVRVCASIVAIIHLDLGAVFYACSLRKARYVTFFSSHVSLAEASRWRKKVWQRNQNKPTRC